MADYAVALNNRSTRWPPASVACVTMAGPRLLGAEVLESLNRSGQHLNRFLSREPHLLKVGYGVRE